LHLPSPQRHKPAAAREVGRGRAAEEEGAPARGDAAWRGGAALRRHDASTAVTSRRSAYLSIRARAAPPSSTLGLPKRAAVASPSTVVRKPELACLAATATFLDSIRGEVALGHDQLDAELLRLRLPSHSLVASCGGGRRDLTLPAPSASLPPPCALRRMQM
jgi:hypothetical protein